MLKKLWIIIRKHVYNVEWLIVRCVYVVAKTTVSFEMSVHLVILLPFLMEQLSPY